jgi:hypothetical protein
MHNKFFRGSVEYQRCVCTIVHRKKWKNVVSMSILLRLYLSHACYSLSLSHLTIGSKQAAVEEYVPLRAQVAAWQSKTPTRFRSAVEPAASVAAADMKLTVPQEFHFHTDERSKQHPQRYASRQHVLSLII